MMFRAPRKPRVVGDGANLALCGDEERLSILGAYGIDGMQNDPELERVARFAARLCNTPLSMVSIVEEERQRFLAHEGTDTAETPRPTSFCAHAMLQAEVMIVQDATKDGRFADNPMVTGEQRVRFYAGAPLVSAEGAPLGALCVIDTEPRPDGLTDLQIEGLSLLADGVMRRLEARRSAILNEERFSLLADNIPDLAWSCNSEGRFDFYNVRWEQYIGAKGPADAEGWRRLIHPEDQDDAFARWYAAVEAGQAFESEYRIRRHDAEWRWVISRALPLKGPKGEITRWFGTVTDIDETRDLSDARDLLSKELSHRIKNIFAVVSGLVALKSRRHSEVGDFAQDLSSSLHALGRAHDYVRPSGGKTTENLQGLLEDLLAPYRENGDDRIVVTGAHIPIGTNAATPLALVFHELSTNAAKYGALSCEDGTIEVGVELLDKEDAVRILWAENARACEDRADTEREGFGSKLLQLSVEGQLSGTLKRTFAPNGMICEIVVPTVALQS